MIINKIISFFIKHQLWTLLIAWAIGLGLKILLWYMEPSVGRDGAFYLRLVQDWYDTGIAPSGIIPPMLFCLVRSIMFLGLDAETAGLIVNIGLGSLLTFVAWGIAYESTHNKKIAIATAVFAALHPSFTALSAGVQREIPYLFSAGVSIWFAIAALQRKKWFLWCGSGIFLASSALTRHESLELLPIYLFAIIVFVFNRKFSWQQCLLNICCLLMSSAIFTLGFFHLYDGGKFIDFYVKYSLNRFELIVKRQFINNQGKEAK